VKTIVIAGAHSDVGKTTLARAIRDILSGAVFVKIGTGVKKEGCADILYPSGTVLRDIKADHAGAGFLIIESNRILSELDPDLCIFLGGEDEKPSAALARQKADLIRGCRASEEKVCALSQKLEITLDKMQEICFLAGANPEPVSAIILAGGASSRMGKDKASLTIEGKPMIWHIYDTLIKFFDEIIISTSKAGDPLILGARTEDPLIMGACTGDPLIMDARTEDLLIMGACTGDPLIMDARTGDPLIMDARTGDPLIIDARTGDPLIMGARTEDPLIMDARIDARTEARKDARMDARMDARTVVDLKPGHGPLMGIYSSLRASSSRVNFIIACDIPTINLPLMRRLLSCSLRYDIVVPSFNPEKYEPLFAVYTKEAATAAGTLLDNGQRRINRLFPLCKTKILEVPAGTGKGNWYANLNTPEDYHCFIKEKSGNGERREDECNDSV
jgi:molybdopterin-guanine dinucleotide biosynthesis protein A